MNDTQATHNFTDIDTNSWIERVLPEWLRPYAYLARYDRPIGIWLLFIPCLWGVLAVPPVETVSFVEGLRALILFAIGSIAMRGAGCTINDWWDKELDKKVERTRSRPLASDAIPSWKALVFLFIQLLAGFLVLIRFNIIVVALGFIVAGLIFAYPLMKRLTYWPQLFLGITFNWGVLMGWAALYPELSATPIFLYLAGILWTVVYDTIYAHQDKQDDIRIGLKSTAILFGEKSKSWLSIFLSVMAICLVIAGLMRDVPAIFYFLLAGVLWLGFDSLKNWNMNDPQSCLQTFKAHKKFGLWIALLWLVALVV